MIELIVKIKGNTDMYITKVYPNDETDKAIRHWALFFDKKDEDNITFLSLEYYRE